MQTTTKKSSKFKKNHTSRWYDDTQPCKIFCPNSTSSVRYKKNKFFWWICYFYISQTKSSLDKIFYKIVYHHIIYMCDFLVNLDDFFAMICTSFHEDYGFHQIHCPSLYHFMAYKLLYGNTLFFETTFSFSLSLTMFCCTCAIDLLHARTIFILEIIFLKNMQENPKNQSNPNIQIYNPLS